MHSGGQHAWFYNLFTRTRKVPWVTYTYVTIVTRVSREEITHCLCSRILILFQMSRDMTKPTKWVCTQWRLRSAWACGSESSLSAWINHWSLVTHWAHSEDSDQTGRMPRLFWVIAGRTLTLLVLSCRGSNILSYNTVKCYQSKKDKQWSGTDTIRSHILPSKPKDQKNQPYLHLFLFCFF